VTTQVPASLPIIAAAGIRSFESVPLESVSETTVNASIGDLNGDGILDIVLAKGRHWPLKDVVLFGDVKVTSHRDRSPRTPPTAVIRRPWPISIRTAIST
jgi:hypothetical protein